jgi:hypothetical protein
VAIAQFCRAAAAPKDPGLLQAVIDAEAHLVRHKFLVLGGATVEVQAASHRRQASFAAGLGEKVGPQPYQSGLLPTITGRTTKSIRCHSEMDSIENP